MILRPLALCVALIPGAALAQNSIAFVQAAEQGGGVALAATADEAIAAATAQCAEGGAYPDDCLVTNVCTPAGWSVDIFVQHTEGNHWHEAFCGLPEQSVAERMEEVICDTEARPYLMDCALAQIWDPEGNPQKEW